MTSPFPCRFPSPWRANATLAIGYITRQSLTSFGCRFDLGVSRKQQARPKPSPALQSPKCGGPGPGLLGYGLRAGGNERIVGRVADAARCGPLARKDRRISGDTAVGDEKHFIIGALRRTAGCIAARAHDADPTRRARRPGIALLPRGTGRSRVALLALRRISTAHKAGAQRDDDQSSVQLHWLPPRRFNSQLCYELSKNYAEY